jgi:PKD repeat protein
MVFSALSLVGVTSRWNGHPAPVDQSPGLGHQAADSPSLPVPIEENIPAVEELFQVASAPGSVTLASQAFLAASNTDKVITNCDDYIVSFDTDQGNPGRTIFIATGTAVNFVPEIRHENGYTPRVLSVVWLFPDADGETMTTDPDTGDAVINFPEELPRQLNAPNVPNNFPSNQVEHTYEDAGSFDLGLRLFIQDTVTGEEGWCTAARNSTILPYIFPGVITVTDTADANPASFAAEDEVRDLEVLVPINEWVPLISFNMSFAPDSPAPSVLARLVFTLRNNGTLTPTDISRFGIFEDRGGEGGAPNGEFEALDFPIGGNIFQLPLIDPPLPIFTFDSQGNGTDIEGGAFSYDTSGPGDLFYDLNFIFDPDSDTGFLPEDQWLRAGPDPGQGYFLAVRTSATWNSPDDMGITVFDAEMRPIIPPRIQFDDDGNIIGVIPQTIGTPNPDDTYSPDFSQDVLDAGTRYVSNDFNVAVTDIRSPLDGGFRFNQWNWPNYQYTPTAEFNRFRFNATGLVLQSVLGQTLDIRDLLSIEAWSPLLGWDLHGTPAGENLAQPAEINLVLTDIGGDPFGPPGNGGFDPRNGRLNNFTTETTTLDPDNLQVGGEDHTFNGVGLFWDANNTGLFEPPVPRADFGVNMNGTDTSMFLVNPSETLPVPHGYVTKGLLEWEYVPFPPGGGDPWWRIKMAFDGGARPGGLAGRAEPAIGTDFFGNGAPKPDFFIVMRGDSGFRDISGLPGDGTALPFGADMRAFIEPRRWNPEDGGHWDGGMLVSSQFAGRDRFVDNDGDLLIRPQEFWQDDPTIDSACPEGQPCGPQVYDWFTSRSQNQTTVKPVKYGIDVHDLVLTYSTNNQYAKVTTIRELQGSLPFILFQDPPIINAPTYDNGNGRDIPRYEIPELGIDRSGFGIIQLNFFDWDQATILGDLIPGFDDIFLNEHYAYETVPFKLDDNAFFPQPREPRSLYYPNPPEQPTLPDILNWPPIAEAVAFGFNGYCYLESEGAIANERYLPAQSVNSEASYADDVYVFVGDDCNNCASVQPGMWLIDKYGARFSITAVNGERFTLLRGHNAYMDRVFRTTGNDVDIEDYPFGVQVGEPFAVNRGTWAVVEDAMQRGQYTRQQDWPAGLASDGGARAARLLKQKVEVNSVPTAMLGINLAGVDDPIVNASETVSLNSITVAFWGPEFDRSDLAPLDPDGTLISSGVLLFEDINGNGVFDGGINNPITNTTISAGDRIVPVEPDSLQWSGTGAEPIDLDGDFKADDLSGDGLIALTQADRENFAANPAYDGLLDTAWVLRLEPDAEWTVPFTDIAGEADAKSSQEKGLLDWPSFWTEAPTLIDLAQFSSGGDKQLATTSNGGDDLFIAVRTSNTISQFEQFRALIPSKLPTRSPASEKVAGIEMSPETYPVVQSFVKTDPEEGVVQSFLGHDMLESSVPSKIVDLTASLRPSPLIPIPVIEPGSAPVAVLGIDSSANRPANQIGAGASGSQNSSGYTTASFTKTPTTEFYDSGWTDEVVGMYLIGQSDPGASTFESRVEAFEITAVSNNDLTLRAGQPRVGSPWILVKDPTFLEQVIVEMYDAELDGAFDPQRDLLPMNFEDPAADLFSGLSLYRDNDFSAKNRNGVFDPPVLDSSGNVTEYIDLPINLDAPPTFIGVPGEPEYQVRMVFSTPGTDDLQGRTTVPYEDQTQHRQWVPQTFGLGSADPNTGSDFFVVLRTSREMTEGDDFQIGIVSWGPNTPTLPDPDNFTPSLDDEQLPGQRPDEFDIFDEFPWGNTGLGYITFFRDPPPSYYWGYDQVAQKQVAVQEVDRSQDDKDIRYWVRSHPAITGATNLITSLPAPDIDFTADRNRQVPGGTVVFTLLTDSTVSNVLWDFGDGKTSTQRNPSNIYQNEGLYTVSVTVTNNFGVSDTVTKQNYIEISRAPFADFIGSPLEGNITPDPNDVLEPGLNVSFIDRSQGTADLIAVNYFWDFGDGDTVNTATRATEEAPLIHRYTEEGFYTVSLEVTFRNPVTQATVVSTCELTALITVRPCVGCPGSGEGETEAENEGEAEDPPAASLEITNLIRDKEALVPLHDWMPLANLVLSYGEDEFAPRFLRTLDFELRPDTRGSEGFGIANINGPQISDILEFGIFQETYDDEEGNNNRLENDNDFLLYTFDAAGSPLGNASENGTQIFYQLDFIGNGTAADPQFPIEAAPEADESLNGNSYILAVRTSATWRSQTTMAMNVNDADMIDPRNGRVPVDDENAPIDSYSPNFFEDEILEDEVAYSASFSVWDITGQQFDLFDGGDALPLASPANFWNHPTFLYTPLQENTRPLWNSIDRLFELTAGEILEMRQLVSTEQWVPVLGINLHSANTEHFDFFDGNGGQRDTIIIDHPQLKEVNLVFTDIGGDPLGPPGNGGFNPKDGLDKMTNLNWDIYEPTFGDDQTYNGAWVWSDTNGNARFDTAVPDPVFNGVNFPGDRPLRANEALSGWEYIPFPPGGGDPWWKITLRFFGGEQRPDSEEGFAGYLDAVPDNIAGAENAGASELTFDYFVTVRADSGFQDVSLVPGDGIGISTGADFRVFVEPRRFDGTTGSQTGGIYVDSMSPPEGIVTNGASIYSTWQDDPRWLTEEPWWAERTHNAKSVKPLRFGLDVHDLSLTYQSDSDYASESYLFFGFGPFWEAGCLTYAVPLGAQTDFDNWNDPFSLQQSKFLNQHSVGVIRFRFFGARSFDFGTGIGEVQFSFDETGTSGQFAYETVPFFSNSLANGDLPPVGPRSTVFPFPPTSPAVPDYSTWPATQRPNEFQRASDWDNEDNEARLLIQHTEANSLSTPLLGINVAGADDPVVNLSAGATVGKVTVAFWGPTFQPSDLYPLDPQGANTLSGVLLWEDADADGVFTDTEIFRQYAEGLTSGLNFDSIVRLQTLQWPSSPELVDINGDGNPDDMDGDGVVDDLDRAWVLDMTPATLWPVPRRDDPTFGFGTIFSLNFCGSGFTDKAGEQVTPPLLPKSEMPFTSVKASNGEKVLDPLVTQPGDDLFITVRTSTTASRFEKIRAVIPASLPEREQGQRQAGIQFFPQFNTSPTAFIKSNPDEDPVQDFYGHDMLTVAVPTTLSDLTDQNGRLVIGGAATAPFGIDASTNEGRAVGTLDSGSTGVPDDKSFQVPGRAWAANRFARDFLVDENYEAYRIVSNTADTLTLESGTPRDGAWRIVTNPTFLETITLEFYNEGTDANFNITTDLLPLKLDQELSGVALYRDNDNDPRNRNGIFDVNIDIPVTLDISPRLVGQTGEAPQVQFTFSTPGTDNVPMPIAQQTRHRQWIYDTLGTLTSDPEFGPDFFVVVRASERMSEGDNFRIGIVGYGPITPTEPDPDTFAGIESEARNDFAKFREFPWAKRGIGYVSFFKEPQINYFMDSFRAGQKEDNSGFDWIRSHSNRKKRTGVITAAERSVSPRSVVIEGASETVLPSQTLPDQPFTVVINGRGFGSNPTVVLSGYEVTVLQSTETAISIAIEVVEGTPTEPVVVIVRNPANNEEASRSDLFRIRSGTGTLAPQITGLTPNTGDSESFPVTITGLNFPSLENAYVLFGDTRMPVLSASPDGTSLTVGFPAGGLPNTGPLSVTVRDLSTNQQDVLLQGFDYKNDIGRSKASIFSCAPGADKGGSGWADVVLVLAVAGVLMGMTMRRRVNG